MLAQMDPSSLVSKVQCDWAEIFEERLNGMAYLTIVENQIHSFMTTVYLHSDGKSSTAVL